MRNLSFIASSVLAVAVLAAVHVNAQVSSDSLATAIRVNGSATLSGDFYEMNATPNGSAIARRPPNLIRLLLSLNLSYGDKVSLPFRVMLSSRETNTVTPPITNASLLQMLQNPLNAVSFSPKIGPAQLYFGAHAQNFSELSGGDAQIFGVGFDVRPGKLRVAGSAGTTQRAVPVDTAKQQRGMYARRYFAGRVGFGSDQDQTSVVNLNLIRTFDDISSIPRVTTRTIITPDSANPSIHDTLTSRHVLMPVPAEGVLSSIDMRAPISDGIAVLGEFALSCYTRDMESPISTADIPVAGTFLDVRTSTRADYAASLALDINKGFWGINAKALYMRPGFVPLGFEYMQSDRLEFTIRPRIALFDGDVSLSGSIGHRTNNLSQTLSETTTQILASVDAQVQFTEALSIGATYGNYGLRNNMTNDTVKIETVSQSLSVTPTYAFEAFDANHVFMLTYSLDDYVDYNIVTGALNNNSTRMILGSYSLSMTGIPLTVGASVSSLNNALAIGDLSVMSESLTASYRLLDGKLIPNASINLSQTTLGTNSSDAMVTAQVGLSWQILKSLSFRIAASTNGNTYGSTRPGVSFTENYLQTSLSTSF